MNKDSLQRMPEITGELLELGDRQARYERAMAFGSLLRLLRDAFRRRPINRLSTEMGSACTRGEAR